MIGGATPPHAVTLDELMRAAGPSQQDREELGKMQLAHEIALDDQFKVGGKAEEEAGNSLESRVRETMHDAFWDRVRAAVSASPPDHEVILKLVAELRTAFEDLTLPHQTKLRQDIYGLIDLETLNWQASHSDVYPVVDYEGLSLGVLDMMARLCSPARDQTISDLRKQSDLVLRFRGIMETMQLMKEDMANFTIAAVRPIVKEHSVAYERDKFAATIAARPDGLRHTTDWLHRAWLALSAAEAPAPKAATAEGGGLEPSASTSPSPTKAAVATEALLQLLDWPDNRALPETLAVDERRLGELRERLLQLSITTSAVLASASAAPGLHNPTQFKQGLKNLLLPQLDAVKQRTLSGKLPQLAETCLGALRDAEGGSVDDAAIASLRSTLLQLLQPHHNIRKIIHDRIRGFTEELLSKGGNGSVSFPSGLGVVKEELVPAIAAFLRLAAHHRAVHGPRYDGIIDGFSATNQSSTNQ